MKADKKALNTLYSYELIGSQLNFFLVDDEGFFFFFLGAVKENKK